mgnify:CR=1 FL=1
MLQDIPLLEIKCPLELFHDFCFFRVFALRGLISEAVCFLFDILFVKIFEIFFDKLASLLYAINRTQWV